MVVALVLILQAVHQFSFKELVVPQRDLKSRIASEEIVGRFLRALEPSSDLRATDFQFDEIPELNLWSWSAKTSDGRLVYLKLPERIFISDSNNKVLNSLSSSLLLGTENEAFLKAMKLKRELGVPISWQIVKDPPILDFGKYQPSFDSKSFLFNFALKPVGHLYSTPGQSFSVRIAARGLRLLDLNYSFIGKVPETRMRITKEQAIRKALVKLKKDGQKNPKIYMDQVGLQNNFLGNQRAFLTEVYVVPFKFRSVIYVDSQTGACSEALNYK